jgi:hypothetical protein
LDEDVKVSGAVVQQQHREFFAKGIHPSAGVSMGCLPQHQWELFLTASNYFIQLDTNNHTALLITST